jgi:hypothetical protein
MMAMPLRDNNKEDEEEGESTDDADKEGGSNNA